MANIVSSVQSEEGCENLWESANPAVVTLTDERTTSQLRRLTNSATFPAVFVDQTYVGGATDTVTLARNGALALMFRQIADCATTAAAAADRK